MKKPCLILLSLWLFPWLNSVPAVFASEWTQGAPFELSAASNETLYGVATANFQGSLWLFKTVRARSIRYRTTSDGLNWSPADGWKATALPKGIRTNSAPALAVLNNRLYLFIKSTKGRIYSRFTTGSSWSAWSSSLGTTKHAPAAATSKDTLYLFARSPRTGIIRYRPFNGSNWGTWSRVSKDSDQITRAAPAAASVGNAVYLFMTATNGRIVVCRSPFPSEWTTIGLGADRTEAPSATLSDRKLFVFAKQKTKGIFYRLLDRSHIPYGGDETWTPVDDRDGTQTATGLNLWMPAGRGHSDGFVVAGAMNKPALKHDRLFLFTWRKQLIPQFPAYGISVPGLFMQWAEWTTLPIQVLQAADDGCSNAALLNGFDEMVRYANSSYAPGLIRFRWNPYNKVTQGVVPGSSDITTCNSLWNIDQVGGEEPALNCDACNDSCPSCSTCSEADCNRWYWIVKPRITATIQEISDAASLFPRSVVVLVRKSHGGGWAGPGSNFIAFVELVAAPRICGDVSNVFHGLGHEIGHYFSLPHTFFDSSGVAKSQTELQQRLTSFNNDTQAAFDGDAYSAWPTWPITDTPSDPFWELGLDSAKCTADPITFTGGIKLYPPRSNMMSYYQETATSIQKISPQQFHNIYNYLPLRGF